MSTVSYKNALPDLTTSQPSDWVRPVDWLVLPRVTAQEEKFVGLHGVWEDGDNVVAFLFQGAYTVDWGDGVVENVASNVKAEHQYSWASIPAGTTTSQGYRQVLITVTPNGGNLTSCNFQQRYTGRTQAYATGFLDVTLSMPNAGSGQSITFGGITVGLINLQRAKFINIGSITSCERMFRSCFSLQDVALFDTTNVTIFSSFFESCYSIKRVPFFNTENANNMANMFAGCRSLVSVHSFNTSKCLSMANMFSTCTALTEAPFMDTALVTNMSDMFNTCTILKTVPHYNTSNVLTMSTMFNNCVSLTDIPLLDTSKVTNMFAVFNGCQSLNNLPLLNTISVTSMTQMFNGCSSLMNIPALSTAGITTVAGSDYGANFATSMASLARCEMVFARTVGFGNAGLSAPALVEIFTNLVDRSATTPATITITGNWGAPLLTAGERAIATSKNWLITG